MPANVSYNDNVIDIDNDNCRKEKFEKEILECDDIRYVLFPEGLLFRTKDPS